MSELSKTQIIRRATVHCILCIILVVCATGIFWLRPQYSTLVILVPCVAVITILFEVNWRILKKMEEKTDE